MARPVLHALIPAAGQGRRFGGAVQKQYLPIAGRPVLAHAIEAVSRHPDVAGVTVVLGQDDVTFAEWFGPGHVGMHTAPGGETRAQSVLNGLHAIRRDFPETEWVLVHDAVRPCLPAACLDALLDAGLDCPDGAILAVPLQDTLKRGDAAGAIVATVEREGLWAAQTPQLFPLGRLSNALEAMLAAGETPTDEASAMQYAGARPRLVMGSVANIKITRPEDLVLAEAWLAARPREAAA